MNLNKVFLIGRLTADPQLRSTPSGKSVCSFSLATNRIWVDKSSARQEETEFHNIVVWGRQAETANQFLKKGSMVLVEGRLQTRSWQDKEGGNRKTTEIIAESIQFGPRAAGGGGKSFSDANESGSKHDDIPTIEVGEDEIKPEDLPF